MGASLSALAVATLVWEAGERKPTRLLVATLVWEAGERKPTRLLVATLVWEPRAGGREATPPFSDDDPERKRNETA